MWQLTYSGPLEKAEKMAQSLEEIALGVTFFETNRPLGMGLFWDLQAIFETQEGGQAFINEMLAQGFLKECDVSLDPLPQKDWLAENRKTFKAIDTWRFYIYGSHDDTPLPKDRITLCIDASTAFGTGHHGTTQGCLEALGILFDDGYTPNRILDVGTGTGILAMGAYRLFQKPVFATDCDPEAVLKANGNFGLNHCPITCVLDESLTDPIIVQNAPYDILIANILAEPLIHLAPTFKGRMAEKSKLILSGILDHQAPSVQKAYENQGFKIYRTFAYGEWRALLMEL